VGTGSLAAMILAEGGGQVVVSNQKLTVLKYMWKVQPLPIVNGLG